MFWARNGHWASDVGAPFHDGWQVRFSIWNEAAQVTEYFLQTKHPTRRGMWGSTVRPGNRHERIGEDWAFLGKYLTAVS